MDTMHREIARSRYLRVFIRPGDRSRDRHRDPATSRSFVYARAGQAPREYPSVGTALAH